MPGSSCVRHSRTTAATRRVGGVSDYAEFSADSQGKEGKKLSVAGENFLRKAESLSQRKLK